MNSTRRSFAQAVMLGVITLPLDLSLSAFAHAAGSANAASDGAALTPLIAEKAPAPGTSYEDLQSLLQAFFGDATGSYVPHGLVDPNDPRKDVVKDLLLNQFAAVYSSWVAERDETTPDGLRVVVRYAPEDRAYKGMVFLDTRTSTIDAVAMSFYRRPPGGIDAELYGQPAKLVSDLFPSVVIFWRRPANLERIAGEVKAFYRKLPMPMEQLLAQGTPSKEVQIKVLARRLD